MGKKRLRPWNRVLPVCERVLFVDWHGVLSDARFWTSVRHHPAVASLDLDEALSRLYTSGAVDEWMRGKLSTRHVVTQFIVEDGNPALVAFFEDRVIHECVVSTTRRKLVQVLMALKSSYHLVLATDNMDCFSEALPSRRDLMRVFDDYLTSVEVGALKSEDPQRFFLPWLEDHDIPVEAAVLIDDRRKNCDRFRELGGDAIVFDGTASTWAQLAQLRPA